MHATIRRYRSTGGRTEELARAVCEIASNVSRVRGFVSCLVMEVEPGALTMVGIFEDPSCLEEANGIVERSIGEQKDLLISEDSQVATGEIIFQRGL